MVTTPIDEFVGGGYEPTQALSVFYFIITVLKTVKYEETSMS